MVRLAEKIHPDILRIVLDEAVFRARELPLRTPAFREAYFKKNGVTDSTPGRCFQCSDGKTGGACAVCGRGR
jgi:hypothetical protein